MTVEDDVETPDLDNKDLRAKLEELVGINVSLENELIEKHGAKPNAFVIASMRLDLLLSWILDETQRFEYEIESAIRVSHLLRQIKEQFDNQSPLIVPDQSLNVPTLKIQ